MRRNQHLAGDLAAAVLLVQRNGLLMRGELKDRVRGRIEDPGTRSLMLLPEPVDDRRAAADHVADHFAPRSARELLDDLPRKAVRITGKGFLQMHAGDFPVTGGAVLPRR